MSNIGITPENAVMVLNESLRLDPDFREGMEFEKIEILNNNLPVFSAKNALDPLFATVYKRVVNSHFPNCKL